jgi:tetraacyldisaccharide 4'-kinase
MSSRFLNRFGSRVWSTLNGIARESYRGGWATQTILDPRVISVGNIQAGGAGKTPLVSLVAREAVAQGYRVCILIRGYRGRWEQAGGVIEPGTRPARASDCGDEAALLHERVPEAWIGVGADRVAAFESVRERTADRFDLVILDDGFQHFAIRKDLEIVALTSARPGDRLFRDAPEVLRQAGLIVWTKGHEQPEFYGRPWCRVVYELPTPAARAASIWLVTGVGDSDQVRRTVEQAGYPVLRHVAYADHSPYSLAQARDLLESARAAGASVALTGKDWVKWMELGISRESVQVLEPELRFVQGREVWDQVVWGKS